MSLVTQLGSQMDEASDNEDYERAAELFEAITAANVQLEQVRYIQHVQSALQ